MPPEILARLFIPVAAALLLGGCATKMQRKLHGQPVAVAVEAIGDGAPDHAMDLPGGYRLFEWITTDVMVQQDTGYDGDERWWTSERRLLDGGWPNRSCVRKVLARWDAARETWVVARYRNVWNEGCSMRAVPRPFRPISYLKD